MAIAGSSVITYRVQPINEPPTAFKLFGGGTAQASICDNINTAVEKVLRGTTARVIGTDASEVAERLQERGLRWDKP